MTAGARASRPGECAFPKKKPFKNGHAANLALEAMRDTWPDFDFEAWPCPFRDGDHWHIGRLLKDDGATLEAIKAHGLERG